MTARRWRDLATGALLIAALWFAARVMTANWSSVREAGVSLAPRWSGIVASALIVLACYAILIETWRRMVRTWGSQLAAGDAAHIWFVSNLGRYVPGKVWQIGAMGMLAQRAGVAPDAAVGSSLVLAIVNILAGLAVILGRGSGALDLMGIPRVTAFIGGAAALGATLALPWLLPMIVRAFNRVTGRALREPRVPLAAILAAFVGCALAWLGYGIAFSNFAAALVPPPSAATVNAHIVAFTLSYLAGYLAVFAPGGIGVRELSLAALLTTWLGYSSGDAGIIVLTSRVWLTVLEVLPGAALLALAALTNLRTKPS
ncbi:MAG: hypothetical protein C0503_03535 [Gemmatimonas sp.]|nr:hypothetical protein [Gemmatimonas sp.]